MNRDRFWGYVFLSPWIFGFLALTLGPMVASLVFSFTKYDIINTPVFVGWDNYLQIFSQDPKFWNALAVTFLFSFVAVPLTLALGFLLAYFLNLKIPGARVFRTIYYMPSVLSGVVIAILFRGLFDEKYGIINGALALVGIRGPDWLTNPQFALAALVIIALWGVGGGIIIYLAGLQGIPTSLYEAADLDGAGRRTQFFRVTLPMMSPVIFFNLVMGIISAFQYFTEAWVLTRGGPAEATQFYNIYLYKTAFSYMNMGYASALAWVLFFLILILTLLVFRSSAMWVYYEGEMGKK
ncbi:MAG TPA: sugar ABC transporter permease [Spirochaetia bacterium]|nr:sugar ABC transporter permease [Spirochaetia bacterium]